MADSKGVIESAIARAQDHLGEALSELEKITSFGPSASAYAMHALGNYLAVTGAAVSLITRRLAQHPDPQIAEWLASVSHATDLMACLIGQTVSTSTNDPVRLRFEKVDLVLAVQRFGDCCQRAMNRKSIRLIQEAAPDAPPVWTDRVVLLSVLDNLVSNAIKYSMPEKRVWLRVQGETETVLFEVRDEGPGLSQQDQERLFQRGVRLTPKPTGGEPSTGYGLAIARDLVQKLRGEIWCESELGRGSSFFVRLPVWRESKSGSASGSRPSDVGGPSADRTV